MCKSKVGEKGEAKANAFLRDIIIPYDIVPGLTTDALNYPKAFNVEYLTEIALAKIGGYTYLDEDGYDFDDYSDSKTSSVEPGKQVSIPSLEEKIGDIRCIVYNPFYDKLDYFFFPYNKWKEIEVACYGKQNKKTRIRSSYNVKTDSYKKFEEFRVFSFQQLASKKSTISEKNA